MKEFFIGCFGLWFWRTTIHFSAPPLTPHSELENLNDVNMRQCRIMYEYFLPNNHLLKANNGNTNYMLFIKPGIQERGMECEECAERGGMFTRIPGNVIILTFQGMSQKKCSRRFRGMFNKILGNVWRDSGECSRRFRGMLKKILGI